MKKILFVSFAAFLFSVGAMAQTTAPATDKKSDMKDLRKLKSEGRIISGFFVFSRTSPKTAV